MGYVHEAYMELSLASGHRVVFTRDDVPSPASLSLAPIHSGLTSPAAHWLWQLCFWSARRSRDLHR